MKLRPFLSFYGAKWRATKLYPKPKYDTIIEPFAGSAGYSVNYYDRNIILYEIDPKIAAIWEFLIGANSEDIMQIPIVDHVDSINGPQEVKWFVGFWLGMARSTPGLQVTGFDKWHRDRSNYKAGDLSTWSVRRRQLIADQVQYIKHWKIYNRSYGDCPNLEATWFIDPPYNNKAGRLYKYRNINYNELGDWCRKRNGQTIVCENVGADWLPFSYLGKIQSNTVKTGRFSEEVMWYNERTRDHS